MDAEEYRKNLEFKILEIIKDKLEEGQMDTDRARKIAKMVLDKLHPPLTLEQIHQIAPSLDDHFTELADAVLPIVEDHQREIEKVVAQHATRLINSGKFEEAGLVMGNVMERREK